MLTPTGAHCEDAWVVTAALIAQTTRLKFLVAFRPGLIEPALAAHMAATFQQLSARPAAAQHRGRQQRRRAAGLRRSSSATTSATRAPASSWTCCARPGPVEPFDHHGPHYDIEARSAPTPARAACPRVYLGGSSDPAIELAAAHADTYLTWGEPPALVAEKIARVSDRAAATGRTLRFGLRIHVITRDTADAGLASTPTALIAGIDDATIAAGQQRLRSLESVGQQRMLDLHGGSRERLVVAPEPVGRHRARPRRCRHRPRRQPRRGR